MDRRASSEKSTSAADLDGAARAIRLDPLIHERVRLGILSALSANDRLSFTELRDALGVSDGNLGVHARKLEDAGHVVCDKRFAQRKPRSEYRLTTKGRNAFASYLFQLESLIQSARNA
ncbi:MAG: transcriptional regulator [marine benthic group bacterium]|jgi:DNA-binding HxlR family transcriptional regulator|nr:transcriptional regulator [Gemmatimonadota bacterium]MCL7963601.1 transcriptional regulator [Candidatus Carthagonibacter metallireducens]MCL7937671.1 transcriptional regulator [Gemmatimonadota bacterium]MCL7957695.1 transcriptional regulator [Gemmatimonadota bacterium]MCL7964907.1 transcriptional regulator [Gemmatimonadota bacterium]